MKSLREAERCSAWLDLASCLCRVPPPMGFWYQLYWVQIPALLLHGCVTLHTGFTSLNLPPFLCLPHATSGHPSSGMVLA